MSQRLAVVLLFVSLMPLRGGEPDPSKARVEGTVVDEAGKPVAGVVVRGRQWRSESADISSTTDGQGVFRMVLDGPSAQAQRIIASVEGGKRQGFVALDYSANDLVTKVRIVLKPARTVTVRVVNDQNDPVLAASVGLLEYSIPL